MDVPAIRVTLADCSFADCTTANPFYLKLCRDLQLRSFGAFKIIHVGCCILYRVRSFAWTGDINQVDVRRHSALEVKKNIKLV